MATIKEELLVLEIKVRGYHIRYIAVTYSKLPLRAASCRYVRQVAVTCRRGTSVARSLKLLALPY